MDIAAYDISITEARKAIIDFAPPFYFHSTSILILAPEPQHTVKLWAWTSPFGWIVWACLIATLIVVSLFLYAGHVFGPTELWAHKKFHSIAECVAYIGSGVINQGQYPVQDPSRGPHPMTIFRARVLPTFLVGPDPPIALVDRLRSGNR